VFASPRTNPQDTSGCNQKPSPKSQNHGDWREPNSRRSFFRSLLERRLTAKLAMRAHWEVFVEGDDTVSFADLMFAIDTINGLHAKALILTPRLKEQVAKACPSR